MKLWNRIRYWIRRPRLQRDLSEEIRLHREMLQEQFIAQGMSPVDARTAAARQFGSASAALEDSREQWNLQWLAATLKDIRFAWRIACRQPLLSAAVVLIIAFGVGANAAVVSVLETVLLNPLGLRQADRVMVARVRVDSIGFRHMQTSGVEFREIQSMTDTFSAVAALEGRYWTAQMSGEPVRLRGQAVTPDFFEVFGIYPRAGRFFSSEDRECVVLSHGFWQSQFGGEDSVIGRTLLLDDKPHRIVGVAPSGFRFPATAQIWTPLIFEPQRLQRRGYNMNLWVIARLKDQVSQAQASDHINGYVEGLKLSDEGRVLAQSGYGIELDPLAYFVAGDLRRPLWLLFAAALVVLLTGCANIAGLLLTRMPGRRHEIAVRISVGAAGTQILRQLLIESLLLSAVGSIFGLILAGGALFIVGRLGVPGKEWLALVALDRRMLICGFGLALLSGLLFGLAPALQLLKESQAAALVRSRRRWFQDVFVIGEVTGAFVLIVITVLLLRSLWAVERIKPGFDSKHLTTAFLIKPKNDPGFLDRLREELRAGPGTESAALAYPLPFSGGGLTSGFSIRDRQRQSGEPEWHGEAYMISPEYLHTLRIPLLRGRNLADSDTVTSPLVCLIDIRLAERFFPNQDPIGQEIAMYKGYARIVGVVGAIRGTTLEEGSRPVVYYSLAQVPFFPQEGIVVRSSMAAGGQIRDAVRRTNGTVPIYDMRSMEDRIGESLGIRRVLALLLAVFGGVTLVLATVGLYGVVAQVVANRTNEIGIRMALGARPGQILAQFAQQGLRAGIIGLGCGWAAAAYAQYWVTAMLYQVRPFDLATFSSASVGVLMLLVAAVWWPARRASLIDPQRALRYE
jgi:putative ABC transport system permease protein